ncbi:MAG: hypothetical protein IH626_11170 [Rhodospirillales bacterium]|nr:hypothetical protein [Rhodospirillales bacterium]
MHYLGGLRGAGVVACGEETLARADYEFDGFLMKPGQVMCSGELRMPWEALKDLFGRRDLKLVTDDGRHLSLQFSEKTLRAESDAAHVNVGGDLPLASEWRH